MSSDVHNINLTTIINLQYQAYLGGILQPFDHYYCNERNPECVIYTTLYLGNGK